MDPAKDANLCGAVYAVWGEEMTAPIEFTEAHIRASSEPEDELFRGFLRSGEPNRQRRRN